MDNGAHGDWQKSPPSSPLRLAEATTQGFLSADDGSRLPYCAHVTPLTLEAAEIVLNDPQYSIVDQIKTWGHDEITLP